MPDVSEPSAAQALAADLLVAGQTDSEAAQQAGEALEVTSPTVSAHVQRGLASLCDHLGVHGDDEA